jgi:hypothetical protein
MSRNLMKVHSIERSFSQSKMFGFNKISSCFISLMNEIFCFTRISNILIGILTIVYIFKFSQLFLINPFVWAFSQLRDSKVKNWQRCRFFCLFSFSDDVTITWLWRHSHVTSAAIQNQSEEATDHATLNISAFTNENRTKLFFFVFVTK